MVAAAAAGAARAGASKRVKETAADRALKRSKARGDIRKMLVETQAESQVKISRERGRQRRSVERTKAQQIIAERQGSERARTDAYKERSEIAAAQKAASARLRLETAGDLAGLQRRERIINSGTSAVTGSSVWGTLTMITTLFFTMIIIYVVVRNGEQFGGLASSVGNFIEGLSSNRPLFVTNG